MERPLVLTPSKNGTFHREFALLLRRHGFRIPESSDPGVVLKRIETERPDLMVLLPPNEQVSDPPGRSPTLQPPSGGLIEEQRFIGESASMKNLKAYIARLSTTDTSVLITGETGTGKELVAELIQVNSLRPLRPFIRINCAAIPDSLLESELFGYERGAFTGAQSSHPGKLELADGGTVFFDEIGDMSPYAQAKILRVIESKEVQRLGGRRSIRLDIRIIAATNQDLDLPTTELKFRRDLYFRLNVVRIHLLPLRERIADIPLLLNHYIQDLNRRFGRQVEGFTDHALEILLRHGWPGNIRELRNLLEAVFVNLPPSEVRRIDLPETLRRQLADVADLPPGEQELLLSALWSTDWNKSKAARKLHWSRMTLYRKMTKYHLVEEHQRKKPLQRAAAQECNAMTACGTQL